MSVAPLTFEARHLGPSQDDQRLMLAELGVSSLEDLASQIVPAEILLPLGRRWLACPSPAGKPRPWPN